jgi:hypothetical protein
MRKRISCPECGKEMNLWACAGISKGTLGKSVLDGVRGAEAVRKEEKSTKNALILLCRRLFVQNEPI